MGSNLNATWNWKALFSCNPNLLSYAFSWLDYDEKAEDAVDYEDIEEQYEGPEVQAITEEDYLLPEKDYVSTQVSASVKGATSVFDDENYDEESEKENEADENNNTEVQTTTLSGFFYCDLNSLFNGRSILYMLIDDYNIK